MSGWTLLIIGIASSVILVNNSSINNIINGQTSVEKNFQLISEESILSSKILGWFPGKSSQKIYILDSNGNKTSEFNSESANEANKKQIPKAEKEIIR